MIVEAFNLGFRVLLFFGLPDELGKCAVEWPPLAAAADSKASGDWTIVTRDDGSLMWAYEGKPLYTFVDDKKAGDVTGDNVDGFHIVS
jgi:predicted lipoprotein with Yx(FWY)xxD motif